MRIVHFEIPGKNLEKLAGFYDNVFGWKTQKWGGPEEYLLTTTGPDGEPGINGAFFGSKEKESIRIVIEVPSVDEYMKKIAAAGGKLLTEKQTIPGIGYTMLFEDIDGNMMDLLQNDPGAK